MEEIKLLNPLPGSSLLKYPNGDVLQFFGENRRAYSYLSTKDYEGNIVKQIGHGGIDIRPKNYKDIYVRAAHNGFVNDISETGNTYARVRSNKTANYYMTIYGHLEEILVRAGQEVKAGDIIGKIGNKGYELQTKEMSIKSVQVWGKAPAEYGYHLHFGLRVYENNRVDIGNGYAGCIDPLKYLIPKIMIENLVIHHTAVSYKKNADQWEATNKYHKDKWNFVSSLGFYAGYHYEIAKDGTTRQARADDEMGAHTIDYNDNSIGIALDGNFEEEKPTEEQLSALKILATRLNNLYHFKKVGGHRDFNDRSCPGKFMTDEILKNLTKNTMKKLYLDEETKKQYIEGDDKVKRWIFNQTVLEAFHAMGVIDKNNPIKVPKITGIIGKPIAIIDDEIINI